jgi:uncharacterized membrane protein
MKTLLNYFARGLLFIFPIFATIYLVIALIGWLNNFLNNSLFAWLAVEIPGLGIVTALFIITMTGFLFTNALSRPIVSFLESIMIRTPLIKFIYTSIKDLTEAFVGDKKRFNRPVLVSLNNGVDKVGFVTDDTLHNFGVTNRIAVYCPHSYNFSGNLFLVDPALVKPLNLNSSDVMKFVVSAGVTSVEEGVLNEEIV